MCLTKLDPSDQKVAKLNNKLKLGTKVKFFVPSALVPKGKIKLLTFASSKMIKKKVKRL